MKEDSPKVFPNSYKSQGTDGKIKLNKIEINLEEK